MLVGPPGFVDEIEMGPLHGKLELRRKRLCSQIASASWASLPFSSLPSSSRLLERWSLSLLLATEATRLTATLARREARVPIVFFAHSAREVRVLRLFAW